MKVSKRNKMEAGIGGIKTYIGAMRRHREGDTTGGCGLCVLCTSDTQGAVVCRPLGACEAKEKI